MKKEITSGIEINTKAILEEWKSEIMTRSKALPVQPKLNIVVIGNRDESRLYVNNKIKKAEELGVEVNKFELEDNVTQVELNLLMSRMMNPTILQLPIPKHLDHTEALKRLDPALDVDGLTIYQKGLLADGCKDALVPATALGVLRIIESLCNLRGKKVVIVSRSELIGKPLANLILERDGYPVITHSKVYEVDLHREMITADVIVTGCGRRYLFNSSDFRNSGQIIIDCSMAKEEGIPGVGDVDKDDILRNTSNMIASGYGHTGPATVLALINNVIKHYELRTGGLKCWL